MEIAVPYHANRLGIVNMNRDFPLIRTAALQKLLIALTATLQWQRPHTEDAPFETYS